MECMGNSRSNAYWEFNSEAANQKPSSTADRPTRAQFIRDKYMLKLYANPDIEPPDPRVLVATDAKQPPVLQKRVVRRSLLDASVVAPVASKGRPLSPSSRRSSTSAARTVANLANFLAAPLTPIPAEELEISDDEDGNDSFDESVSSFEDEVESNASTGVSRISETDGDVEAEVTEAPVGGEE